MIHMTGGYFNEVTAVTDSTILLGRRKIKLNIPNQELSPEQLISILNRAFFIHDENAKEIQYLYQYYKGNQPILYRDDKIVRPEIDNRVVENWAKFIVDFKLGFIWGEPIQLIKNSNARSLLSTTEQVENEEVKDKQVIVLNEYFQENEKHLKDKDAGFWTAVAGVGYLCVLPNTEESIIPFKVYSLDPRNTFIIYSADFKEEPVMAVTFNVMETAEKDVFEYLMTIYTKTFIYQAKSDQEFQGIYNLEVTPNVMGMIPVVEFNYDNSRQGSFESIIPLLNNLNLISSDRMNDVEQAVQWFMKFINVDIDEEMYEKFKSKGVIVVKGEPGNTPIVDSVVNTLDQSQIQVFKDDMVRAIHTLAKVPERNSNPGDNTGQALIVGQGWADAESDAKNVETNLKSGQKQLLKIALKIASLISTVPLEVKSTKPETIDIRFTRNRSDNLLVKTQSLKNMLDSGVHPLLAFKLCGLFDDPQKAYELSKETLQKMTDAQNGNVPQINNGQGPITTGPGQNGANQSEQAQRSLNNR